MESSLSVTDKKLTHWLTNIQTLSFIYWYVRINTVKQAVRPVVQPTQYAPAPLQVVTWTAMQSVYWSFYWFFKTLIKFLKKTFSADIRISRIYAENRKFG